MPNVVDRSTREITCSRIKLAEELIFAPQVHDQDIYYHVEAPSRGAFYRIGYSEYVFVSLLDGSLTIAQALTITARRLGSAALTQDEGVRVAQWLVENGLADYAEQDAAHRYPATETEWERTNAWRRFNPFWIKLSCGSPERLLSMLTPLASWLFSLWATVGGLAIIAGGVGCVATNWDKFSAGAELVLTPHNWLWLGLAWLGLKIAHELAHAVACKHYGGEVRETGVIFMLFAPLAYVDVTSCWRFPSRWQRIHVAAAGMYVELVLAAVAAIIWTRVGSPVIQHWLYNVMVMASLSTLLFNANPLMRFDGYYILADLLEIPNLGTEGSRFVNQLAGRVFYGVRSRPVGMVGFRLWCVRLYGLASTVWRLLLSFSIATAASVLLHGAGLLLAIFGLLGWFGRPLWRVTADLLRRYHEARMSFVRAVGIATALGGLLAFALTTLPWPGALTAPVIVEFADLSIMRSRTAGFVERVHVEDGAIVAAGQLLLELRNPELETERRELELALEQGRVRRRVALDAQDASEVQVAERNLQAVTERLNEVRRRADGLRVLAPMNGRVLARNLSQRVGTYVHEGAELLAVGDERRKELLVSVGQEEVDAVAPLVGEDATFRIGSRAARSGRLERLEPRASTQMPHPAMSSTVGGPLAVTENDASRDNRLQLAEPRFRGVIGLPAETASDLGAGERGYALLGLRRESIGQFMWLRFSRWMESLLKPTPRSSSRGNLRNT